MDNRTIVWGTGIAAIALAAAACAQDGGNPFQAGRPGGRSGFGGPGMGAQEDRPVVKQFDANGDGWLNTEERAKAREWLRANPPQRGPRGGFPGGPDGGPGGMRGPRGMGGRRNREAPKEGIKVSPAEVKSYPDKGLYDSSVLRTIFIDFEEKDWETELAEFHGTDADVAASVTVDGKQYHKVGLRFRGNSSYNMIPAGYKKSFNVDFGMADKKQRLYGYRTLNLLNANGDPTLMRGALYSRIAGEKIPIAKANLVKVVVNGENWGVFGNVQQVDKIFLSEAFKGDDKGIRWKTPGSPMGRANLGYLGDDPAAYKRIYDIKTNDPKEQAEGWKALIELTKTLDATPAGALPAKLEPILDVEGALWFLALENALVNSDGYWVRTSDYNLYRDSKGKFHVVPHDFNETFLPEGGPGGMRGPGGFPGGPGGFGGPPPDFDGGFGGPPPQGFPQGGPPEGMRRPGGADMSLDPLIAEKDERKPLISKLLAVPKYRTIYLRDVAEIATKWLDWNRIKPMVAGYDALIDAEVKKETRNLDGYEAYKAGTGLAMVQPVSYDQAEGPRGPGGRAPDLKSFVVQRRKYLLNHPAVKAVLTPVKVASVPKAKMKAKVRG